MILTIKNKGSNARHCPVRWMSCVWHNGSLKMVAMVTTPNNFGLGEIIDLANPDIEFFNVTEDGNADNPVSVE